MTITLTTPAGKVRSASARRYVLVRWRTYEESKPRIVKRSDSLDTIRAHRRRAGFEHAVSFTIFDSTTGEAVK